MVKAEGYGYDPKTNEWTERIEYEAQDKHEAESWIKFNRDWMKQLKIIEQ